MSCGGCQVDLEELRHRLLAMEVTIAELASWTHFNLKHENNGIANPMPVVVDGDGLANSRNLGGASTVSKIAQIGSLLERNFEDDIDIVYKVEVEEMDGNYEDQMDNLQESSDPQPPILEFVSSIQELQDEVVEYEWRMPTSAAGGNGSGSFIIDERFDDQEAIAQIKIVEEDIWRRMSCPSEEGDSSYSESESISSIELQEDDDEDWIPPTGTKYRRGVVNQKKDKGTIPPRGMIETDVCQNGVEHGKNSLEEVARTEVVNQELIVVVDETIDCMENGKQFNSEGNDKQETSDDLLPPILEAFSSIQSLDESTEYEMPSLIPEIDYVVWPKVEHGSDPPSGSVPKVEHGSDSSIGSVSNEAQDKIDEGWIPKKNGKGVVNQKLVNQQSSQNMESVDSDSQEDSNNHQQTNNNDEEIKKRTSPAAAPITESVSPSQPQNDNECRMSSTAGSLSGWEILNQPLDDQETNTSKTSNSQTVKMIEEEEILQRRMDCSSEEGDSSCSETISSIELQDDEEWMPPTKSKSSRCVVNQKKDKGTIPPQLMIEVEGCDYSQGSARKRTAAQKQNKMSPKKVTLTATKSVSIKRLSSTQILSIKNKLRAKSQPLKCPHCPKTLDYKSHLTRHIRSHTGERPFPCPHCPAAMKHKKNLRDHIHKFHPEENQNLLPCRICLEKFPSQRILTLHMKSHLKCYFCSKKVTNIQRMESHLATHTGEKPFSCPHCSYSTAWEGCLKAHIHQNQKHQKDKPSWQKGCGEPLRKTDGQFHCYFCPFTTNFYHNLVPHLRIHTGEKPFRCSICSYSAYQRRTLQTHTEKYH